MSQREHPIDSLPRPLKLGRNTYILERSLGQHNKRYRARLDAKKNGDSYLIQMLPRDRTSIDHIQALKRFNKTNPNVPGIQEIIVENKWIYLVMSWMEGLPLRQYLDEAKKYGKRHISVFETIRMFTGFAHGLAHLSHRKNIVHGDIKPENIIVCPHPNRLALIDFGSAWVAERTAVRFSMDGYDSHYAAPELQLSAREDNSSRKHRVDFRSDQFSSSIVLYEMLTNEIPFEGAGGQAGLPAFDGMYDTRPVPPSTKCLNREELPASVWKLVDRLVLTGLAFDPDKRFQNASSWLDAFKEIRFEIEKTERLSNGSKLTLWAAGILDWFRGPSP